MKNKKLNAGAARKSIASALVAIVLAQGCLQSSFSQPVNAQSTTTSALTADSFSRDYTVLTKQILQKGIELERFSLKYRLEAAKQPKFRRLRYFLSQEAGAAGGLAFEITAVDQFERGRRHPLQINKGALENSLKATTTTSIIAASGSGLELTSNFLLSLKNRKNGYDPKSANKFVASKLKNIDDLLAQRDALVQRNSSSPAYEYAVAEGRVLHAMRNSFINEYTQFSIDTRSYLAFQNLFYLLNTSYNVVGATAAGIAYKAVTEPELNGPANILFIVSGGLAMVSPILSTGYSKWMKNHARRDVERALNEKIDFKPGALAEECKKLERAVPVVDGSLIPSLPVTQRLGLYTQSSELFQKQLANETKIMHKLEKVALQTSEIGPLIGGALMTQGILGTVGYYKYTVRPRKQIGLFYGGAVVGTVGTSAAVVGNAAWLLASYSYERNLAKKKQLPRQLIQARLDHLVEIEKVVASI
ncbi:MAG: hypothetical protein IAF58_04015 [Leptolyngbya sp.]|nr:hypothetical protein [Candidatus Melainabacteria bacterium]